MLKRLPLLLLSSCLIYTADASDINNSNNSQRPVIQQHANLQQKECISASIQLNLDAAAAQHVFTVADNVLGFLPVGISADFGTNTPHVTLETFEPLNGGNLTSQQLNLLRDKLGAAHQAITSFQNADAMVHQHRIFAVTTGLKLIAKFSDDTRTYYTKANIAQLKGEKRALTECFLSYECDFINTYNISFHEDPARTIHAARIPSYGTNYLKELGGVFNPGLVDTGLKHGPFAENPLCHVTLMKWKATNPFYESVVNCFLQICQLYGDAQQELKIEALVLNPMFAGNSDKGKTPYFDPTRKMQDRAKTNWAQAPRAYIFLLPENKKNQTNLTELQERIKKHEECMSMTRKNLDTTRANIAKGHTHLIVSGIKTKTLAERQQELVEQLAKQQADLKRFNDELKNHQPAPAVMAQAAAPIQPIIENNNNAPSKVQKIQNLEEEKNFWLNEMQSSTEDEVNLALEMLQQIEAKMRKL